MIVSRKVFPLGDEMLSLGVSGGRGHVTFGVQVKAPPGLLGCHNCS